LYFFVAITCSRTPFLSSIITKLLFYANQLFFSKKNRLDFQARYSPLKGTLPNTSKKTKKGSSFVFITKANYSTGELQDSKSALTDSLFYFKFFSSFAILKIKEKFSSNFAGSISVF
jgi:hypothetical protein